MSPSESKASDTEGQEKTDTPLLFCSMGSLNGLWMLTHMGDGGSSLLSPCIQMLISSLLETLSRTHPEIPVSQLSGHPWGRSSGHTKLTITIGSGSPTRRLQDLPCWATSKVSYTFVHQLLEHLGYYKCPQWEQNSWRLYLEVIHSHIHSLTHNHWFFVYHTSKMC